MKTRRVQQPGDGKPDAAHDKGHSKSRRNHPQEKFKRFQREAGHVVRPHILSQLPLITLGVILALLVEYLAIRFPSTTITVPIQFWGTAYEYSLPILLLLPLLIMLKVVHTLYDEMFLLQPDKLVQKVGLFSLKSDRIEVLYKDIATLNVSHHFWGRIVDTGEVQIGMSLIDLGKISIHYVHHPMRVKELLEDLIANHK